MKEHSLICIGCPMGCQLTVSELGDGELKVCGNQCPIGDRYGKQEVTNPKRMVTTSMFVDDGLKEVVTVKTEQEIAKSLVKEVVKRLADVKVKAPIKQGQVLYENICGSGVNIIATSSVEKASY